MDRRLTFRRAVSQAFLEYLKSEIIPHEVVEEFRDAGTKFYDGMFIVPHPPPTSQTLYLTKQSPRLSYRPDP